MKISLLGYNRKETDDYFEYLTESNNSLSAEVKQLKEKLEQAEKELSEYKSIDDLNKREIEALNGRISDYESAADDYKRSIEELNGQLNSKPDVSETEKLGIIFAVAYRDIENKNKAVSGKLKEYAEQMFNRMSAYRSEVSKIVDSVNEMQNRQKEELNKLCAEASEKLDRLTAASDSTMADMKRIEDSRGIINAQIENIIAEAINTDDKPLLN